MVQTAFGQGNYLITSGKLHKGGKATIAVLEEENYQVKMEYSVNKRALVPVPDKYLSGETIISLPLIFKDERGYLELEAKKVMDIEGANLKHLGRTKHKGFNDAHKILITLTNGKSKIELIYHPSLPGAGWDQIKIIMISNIALINGYMFICHLKDV